MDQKYIESTIELMDFIQDSPSCYHVVANAATMLENAGAIRLDEKKQFALEAGNCYFVIRNGSALIAFRMPEGDATGYSVVAAHTDSPSFKLKVKDGKVYYTADSDAVITKGIIYLLIKVFSGQTPEDILAADLSFLNDIGLKEHLSPTRSNGLESMLKQMLLYAEAFKSIDKL